MINNFIKNGVNPNDIEIICAHYGKIPEVWKKLANNYNTVRFFFYRDDRRKPSYISSIRPYLLHKHWLRYPELENEIIFYHDCDIVFSKPINFGELIEGATCYVSDTISYIGAKYIRSKGEHYLDLMTRIVNVNKDLVVSQEENSGGAQYIIKDISAEFWKKVYYDCENLYRLVNDVITKEQPGHALQIWCADMWAVLWNLWFFDKVVKVTDKLSFSWSTSGVDDWEKHPIYHNAGVTVERKELFFKGEYQKVLPYDINEEEYSDKYCSIKYVQEILKTKEVTCLL